MLKQTVQFTDFDGVNKTKALYFNLTRVEVIDNLDIRQEFEDVQEMIGGEARDLEMHEIRLILELVKKLMKMSYGIQRTNSDGELKFTKKDPQIWDDFTESAVYDEFLVNLFEKPDKAMEFLIGIWPKEFTDGLDPDQLKLPGMPVQDAADIPVRPNLANALSETLVTDREAPLSEGDPRPAWVKENREPTDREMQSMTTSEMQLAYRMKASGQFDKSE